MTVVHPQTETRVEYAVRYDDGDVSGAGSRESAEDWLRWCTERGFPFASGARLVQRRVTVTYGEWEPIQ